MEAYFFCRCSFPQGTICRCIHSENKPYTKKELTLPLALNLYIVYFLGKF